MESDEPVRPTWRLWTARAVALLLLATASIPLAGGVASATSTAASSSKVAAPFRGIGLWRVRADGVLLVSGNAPPLTRATGSPPLAAAIVGAATTADHRGAWLVDAQGDLYPYGDAPDLAPVGSVPSSASPVVAMAVTPDGQGLWLVDAQGDLYPYGDAPDLAPAPKARTLDTSVVAVASTLDGQGLWVLDSEGQVRSLGDAPNLGSAKGSWRGGAATSLAVTPDTKGYWIVRTHGTIIATGDATRYAPNASRPGTPFVIGALASASFTTVVASTSALWLSHDLQLMIAGQSPTNPIGLWIGGDPVSWRVSSGPGAAAAALGATDPTLAQAAIQTFTALIAAHQLPNGAFDRVAGASSPSPTGNDVQTMFVASDLGMALWSLHSVLPPDVVAAWTASLVAAAQYLVDHKNLSWYTNGTIVVGNALVMALAAWATGSAAFAADEQAALAFAEDPPQDRWPGAGLVVTPATATTPAAGYFTERSSTDSWGFDANYTQLQLDQLCRLYLVTRSASLLPLIKELTNQLLPRVNTKTWLLNTSGGTRVATPGRLIPFTTPALELLAAFGGEAADVPLAESHLESEPGPFGSVSTTFVPAFESYLSIEVMSLAILDS